MAIKKWRLCRRNENGNYDTICLETLASIVQCTNGMTVEEALASKANSEHIHSGYVPIGRTVNGKSLNSDIALTASDVGAAASSHSHSNYVPSSRKIAGKALSADITVDELKSILGISGSSTITPPSYPSSIPAVGNTMTWAGKTWRVVHKLSGVAILALEYWEKDIVWSNAPCIYGGNQEYIGSEIYNECMTFANTLKLFAADYIIPFGGLPCFIPSYDQVNGGFSYWTTSAKRIFKDSSSNAYAFWTSTDFNYGTNYSCAWYVDVNGNLSYDDSDINNSRGFRPCVAVRL